MIPILILILGIASRLLPHLSNFTPVLAIAFFGGVYLSQRWSLVLPILLMMVTDLIIGTYSGMMFNWIAIGLCAVFGWQLQKNKGVKNVLMFSFLSALVYFTVSNFGVWLVGGLYSLDAKGFVNCYVMALPFFRNTLISTVVYSVILVLGYEYASVKFKVQSVKSV